MLHQLFGHFRGIALRDLQQLLVRERTEGCDVMELCVVEAAGVGTRHRRTVELGLLVMESGWFPLSGIKSRLLRLFGAKIGAGVVFKPHVRIKYPWRLEIGDHCWIGQETWIDNLADVAIGDHVCISQKTYLCTGSHDHRRSTFDLITGTIGVESGAWLGARCTILQNVTIGANAIVAGGSVVHKDVEPATIVGGNPAQVIGERKGG